MKCIASGNGLVLSYSTVMPQHLKDVQKYADIISMFFSYVLVYILQHLSRTCSKRFMCRLFPLNPIDCFDPSHATDMDIVDEDEANKSVE